MPDSWNADTYRARAAQWRQQAETLSPGKEKDACLALAEGYADLAALLARESPSRPSGSNSES
jgi:hypothetical protein